MKSSFLSFFTHPVYHRFEKYIPEVVCNNLSSASPFPLNLSHLLLLYFHHYFPECLSTRGVSLAFNLSGVSEQINILLLTTQPLWTLGCVCNLALARNVNCLVAALHSGPVGLLWVEEKGIFFSLLWWISCCMIVECWSKMVSLDTRCQEIHTKTWSQQTQAELTRWVFIFLLKKLAKI